MQSHLEHLILDFIDSHWDRQRPLLLAFSGGPDSLALLHLLIKYREQHEFQFALAHVDHGWRMESQDEARKIAGMASELQIPLHSMILNPEEMAGNLEAACREARMKFFSTICYQNNYQAVLLAHHADDFAETVLKRVLEGSSLPYLCSLRPISDVYGVQVWRPLLSVSKESILNWLSERALIGFDDRTNRDPKYLRARFRTQILPQLSKDFGKQVNPGLCRIGADAGELRDYLEQRIAPYLAKRINGPLGSFLDLSCDCPESNFELKHLIRRFCETENICLARECIETVASLLREGAADKQVAMGSKHLFVDRRRLFLIPAEPIPLPNVRIELLEGLIAYGQWNVRVSPVNHEYRPTSSNWRFLWQKEGEVILPEGRYYLSMPKLSDPYPRGSPLKKWWTSHKVPSFLRSIAPVVYENGNMVHEFLTGKLQPHMQDRGSAAIKVCISSGSLKEKLAVEGE